MNINFAKNKRIVFIPALLVIVTLQPYLIWENTQLANYVSGILMVILTYRHIEITPTNLKISIIFIFCNLYFFLGGTTYSSFSPVFFLPLLFLIIPKSLQLEIFKKFTEIISVVFALGIITYTLRLFIDLPGYEISPLNSLKQETYLVYLFDVTLPQTIFPKFFSIFDENGVVGTLCALLISYQKININSFKKGAILLAGLLSFSLAFYIVLIINLIYNFNRHYLIFVPIIFIIASFIPKDNILSVYIFDRMEVTEDGFTGNNRTGVDFELHYDYFLKKGGSDLFYGRGIGADKEDKIDELGSSSYKVLVYRHGLLGCSLFLLFFIYLTIKISSTNRGWFFFTIFIILLFQRINLFLYYNIVVYVGGLLMINYNQKILKKSNIN
jgi:hypothetical protein